MTLKKSMFSVAAAGAIAALLTGCGGSGSSSTTSTSQPTSIKAVDGYVMNAVVTALYSDGNSTSTTAATETSALTSVSSYAQTSPALAGSATYNISELNSTVLTNLTAVKLAYQAAKPGTGNIVYTASFFDADASGDYNATKGDALVPANFVMYAPAGFSVISPISTLVYSHAQALIDTNESNKSDLVTESLAQIAAALNISATDIKTVDPVGSVASKPEYALVNAILGDLIDDAGTTVANLRTFVDTLIAQTDASTVSAAFTNLAAASTASGLGTPAVFTSISAQLAADSTLISDVKNWNLDAVRNATVTAGSLVVEHLVATDSDYNVTSVQVADINATDLVSAGAKLNGSTALDNIQLELAIKDQNSSANAQIGFIVKIAAEEEYVVGDANFTELTAFVPVEMNTTDVGTGTLTAEVLESALIVVSYTNDDGSRSSFEANATAIGTTTAGILDDTANVITFNAFTLLNAIDTNLTGLDLNFDRIAKLQVAVVDSAGVLSKTNSAATATSFWGTTTITSDLGTLSKTGKTILDLAQADLRDNRTVANEDGNGSISVTTQSAGETPQVVDYFSIDANATGNNDENITFTISANSLNDTDVEANATAVLSESSDYITLSGTTLTDLNSSTGANGVLGYADFNVTIDTSAVVAATAASHPTAVVTYTVTDEFAAAGSDQNVTITFNREPNVNTWVDINVTFANAGDADDINATQLYTSTGTDVNSSGVALGYFTPISLGNIGNVFGDPDGDTWHNFTFVAGDANMTIDSESNETNTSADANLSFKFQYGDNQDVNLTVEAVNDANISEFVSPYTFTIRALDGNGSFKDANISVWPSIL